MNAYERMLELMRKQGKKDNPNELQLGRVVDGLVVCGGQKLETEDYGDVVLVIQISDSQYIIICKVVSA